MKVHEESNGNITINIDPKSQGDFSPITGTIRMTKGFAQQLYNALGKILPAQADKVENNNNKSTGKGKK